MSHESKRQLAIPLTFFWVFFGLASVQPFVVPYLMREHALSDMKASTVMAAIYFVFALSRFFTPYLIRLIEKKATIVIGVCGYFAFPLVLLLGKEFHHFIVGSIAIGVGAALLWTASSAQVLDVAREKAYGRASGILYFFTQFGIALGTWFYSCLAAERFGSLLPVRTVQQFLIRISGDSAVSSYEFSSVFSAALLFGMVALVSTAFIPRVRTNYPPIAPLKILRIVAQRRNILAPIALMVNFSVYGIMLTMTNQLVREKLGASFIGPVHSCFLTCGVIMTFVWGMVSDRFGRKRALGACFLFGVAGLVLLSFAGGFVQFALAALLLGVPFGGVAVISLAWVGDMSTPENRPAVHAVVFAWRDFGFVLVTYLKLGLRMFAVPFGACFLIFAAIFAVIAALVFASGE